MACESYREALSARADGETTGIDVRLVEAHLESCVECRQFAERVDLLGQATRVATAPAMPDLSRQVVRRQARADRASRWGAVRGLLAVVAVEIIVLSLPALVLGENPSSSAHAARHLGAFAVAYGVGLLVVVARPARARTMLPVAGVLGGALLVTALFDVIEGRVPLVSEATHLPEVLSVLLVWLLARPTPHRDEGDIGQSSGTHRLRLVDDDHDRAGRTG